VVRTNPVTTETSTNVERPHIVVTGLMGVGKSTTARALAESLDLPHRDSDDDLQLLFATSGVDLARCHGVDELHRLEAAVLLGALAADIPAVISAAAWVVEDPRCRDALARRATVIVLDAPLDVVAARIATGHHRRPMDRAELQRVATRRAPLFEEVADITVDATDDPEVVVSTIVEQLSSL
jgi:shikimate kinase